MKWRLHEIAFLGSVGRTNTNRHWVVHAEFKQFKDMDNLCFHWNSWNANIMCRIQNVGCSGSNSARTTSTLVELKFQLCFHEIVFTLSWRDEDLVRHWLILFWSQRQRAANQPTNRARLPPGGCCQSTNRNRMFVHQPLTESCKIRLLLMKQDCNWTSYAQQEVTEASDWGSLVSRKNRKLFRYKPPWSGR